MNHQVNLKKQFLAKLCNQKPRSKNYFAILKFFQIMALLVCIFSSLLFIAFLTKNIIEVLKLNKLNILNGVNPLLLIIPEFIIVAIITIWSVFLLYKRLDLPLTGYGNKLLILTSALLLLVGVTTTLLFDKNLQVRSFFESFQNQVEKITISSGLEKTKLLDGWNQESEFYGTVVEKKENQEIILNFKGDLKTFADPGNLASQIPLGERIEVEYQGESKPEVKKIEREDEEKLEVEHKSGGED
ncbi:MAG: hypothetical protein WCK98_04430 [bacterium]